MSRFFSYLNSAKTILEQYQGEEPFHLYLKKYFSASKKFGSTDRKQIAQLCYSYFRAAHVMGDIPENEKLVYSLFLCSQKPSSFLEAIRPDLNEKAERSLEEKFEVIGIHAVSQTI